jgi:hypothetical protein
MGADPGIIDFTGRKTGLIIPYWMTDLMRVRTTVPISEKKGYSDRNGSCEIEAIREWNSAQSWVRFAKNREFHKNLVNFHYALGLLIEVLIFNSRGSTLIPVENIGAFSYFEDAFYQGKTSRLSIFRGTFFFKGGVTGSN